MTLFQAVKSCFSKYATFSGRASRSEYWYFQLFLMPLGLFIGLISATMMIKYSYNYNILSLFFYLAILVPNIAVTVRRLHDVNRSGWLVLLIFVGVIIVPIGMFLKTFLMMLFAEFFGLTFLIFINVIFFLILTLSIILPLIISLYWLIKESDLGPNRFGEDPLEKLEKRTEKDASKQALSLTLFVFLSFFILTAFVGRCLMNVYEEKPSLNMAVVSGEHLPQEHYQTLLSSQLVQKDDTILYFYSEGERSIMEGGQLLTENGVIVYEKDDGQLVKYDVPYTHIKAVELVEESAETGHKIYQITGNENAKYEYINIFLPTRSGGDKVFIEELNRHIGHKK